jgi:hypothetical protein
MGSGVVVILSKRKMDVGDARRLALKRFCGIAPASKPVRAQRRRTLIALLAKLSRSVITIIA